MFLSPFTFYFKLFFLFVESKAKLKLRLLNNWSQFNENITPLSGGGEKEYFTDNSVGNLIKAV